MKLSSIWTAFSIWVVQALWLCGVLVGVLSVFDKDPPLTTFLQGITWLFLMVFCTWVNWIIIEAEFDDE